MPIVPNILLKKSSHYSAGKRPYLHKTSTKITFEKIVHLFLKTYTASVSPDVSTCTEKVFVHVVDKKHGEHCLMETICTRNTVMNRG